MVSTPSPPPSPQPLATSATHAGRHDGTVGAPCWASLATPDTKASQDFYRAVLGWEFRGTSLGEAYCVALSAGVPTASLGEETPALQIAGDWTPYFSVPCADEAVGRIVERSGTLAVGPVRTPIGRGALAADREGNRFGIWAGQLVDSWDLWRAQRPWRLELRARDVFDAALFYGEVLDWASGRTDCCEVLYEQDAVVLRDAGRVAARLLPADTGQARSRTSPRWNVFFPVPDADAAVSAASRLGGRRIGGRTIGGRRVAARRRPGRVGRRNDVGHPGGGRQRSEPDGHRRDPANGRSPVPAGSQRSRSGRRRRLLSLRLGADGLPDAGDGRVLGGGRDSPPRGRR